MCQGPKFLPFYLDLPLVLVYHQFGLLSTDLHLILCAGFVEISARASTSCSFSARAFMSSLLSAVRRLAILLPPTLTFPSCSSRVSDIIRSRKLLKRVGYRRHSGLTPIVILNHSLMMLFIWTVVEMLIGANKICTDIVLPHGGP